MTKVFQFMFTVDFNLSFSTQIEGNQCVTLVADPRKITSVSSRSAAWGSITPPNGERLDPAETGKCTAPLISPSCVQLREQATYGTKVTSDNAGSWQNSRCHPSFGLSKGYSDPAGKVSVPPAQPQQGSPMLKESCSSHAKSHPNPT